MTGLAVITALAVAFVAIRSRKSPAPLPGLVLSTGYLTLAIAGPFLWSWSASSRGAGLPSHIPTEDFAQSAATAPLLAAALGTALGGVIASLRLVDANLRVSHASSRVKAATPYLLAASLLVYVGWLVGQGGNVISRTTYLDFEGPIQAIRLTSLPGTMLAATGAVLSVTATRRWVRIGFAISSITWFASLLSVGSRAAVAVPLMAGITLFRKRKDEGRRVGRATLAATLLVSLAYVTSSSVLYARFHQHGLREAPQLLAAGTEAALSGETLRQLTASISAAHPIISQSVAATPGGELLLRNANPLPGSGSAGQLETFYPYRYVPLAMVGEWYGAFGFLWTTLLFGLVAVVAGTAVALLQNAGKTALAKLPIFLAAGCLAWSIQYPSRIFWRILSLLVLLLAFTMLQRPGSLGRATINRKMDSTAYRAELSTAHLERARGAWRS